MVNVNCHYQLLVLLVSLWALEGLDINSEAEGPHSGEREEQRVSERSSGRSGGRWGVFLRERSLG